MRPVRAFGVMVAALGLWSAWRFDMARQTLAVMLAVHTGLGPAPAPVPAAATASAPTSPPRAVIAATEAPTAAIPPRRTDRALPATTTPPLAPTSPTIAVSVAPVVAPVPEKRDGPGAHDLAAAAYIALASGDRRAAARQFEAALSADRTHANAALWQAELAALHKAWRVDAYSLIRNGGGNLVSGRPLLGGGQSGVRIGYTPDPLAKRPAELFGRIVLAHDGLNPNSRSAQAAVGVAWMPLGRSGPTIGMERLIALGNEARNAWATRISGGVWHAADAKLPLDLSAYAESGLVGARRRDGFVGAQALALYPVMAREETRFGVGGGVWGGLQDSDIRAVSRLEIGPSAQLSQRLGNGTIELRGEYRFRIAGEAAPESGPAVTIATRF